MTAPRLPPIQPADYTPGQKQAYDEFYATRGKQSGRGAAARFVRWPIGRIHTQSGVHDPHPENGRISPLPLRDLRPSVGTRNPAGRAPLDGRFRMICTYQDHR